MPRSENSISLLTRLLDTSIILHTSGLSLPRRNFIFCHSQRLVTKALKSHYLLALQLPRHSPLVLRGHQIAGTVLAVDPCLLEALSCKPTNKQLKMLFNSSSSSNVIAVLRGMGVNMRVNAQFLNVVGSLSNGDGDGDGNKKGKKSNRFRLAKQQLCTCITLFSTFLCRHCTTTT